MSVLGELRPNKDLLDSDFEGYKLSLDPIPIQRSPFGVFHNPVTVHQTSPSDSQYSIFHSKLFGYHNHLHRDPWQDDVYFINQLRKVHKGIDMLNVWKVPETQPSKPGDYNMSIHFPSKEYALLSDGAGMLYLLHTSSRSECLYWKCVFSGAVCGESLPFKIIHSVEIITPASVEYHCLLHHIGEEEVEGITVFVNILYWVVLLPDQNKDWTVKSKHKLSSKGDFDYAAIEPTGRGIYVASTKPFTFVEVNGNPVEVVNTEEERKEKEPPLYFWKQTNDEITVWLNIDSENFKVIVEPMRLSITCGNKVLLTGETPYIVESDLTTWSHKEGKLEVCLIKFETGLMWKELLLNNKRGEEILDEQLVSEIHERLAHLCSDKEHTVSYSSFNNQQLEECDACPDSATIAARLDLDTLAPSHKITLGGSQFLFNMQFKPEYVPALCLRHDPDGCFWQPKVPNPEDTEWIWYHVGTFDALGYVQASKTQRKFTLCPPDMSYAAICDAKTHIYIYRKPHAVAGELRNRQTGKRVKRVAVQQVINLDIHSKILGACASDKLLHILTDDTLYRASMEILNLS